MNLEQAVNDLASKIAQETDAFMRENPQVTKESHALAQYPLLSHEQGDGRVFEQRIALIPMEDVRSGRRIPWDDAVKADYRRTIISGRIKFKPAA